MDRRTAFQKAIKNRYLAAMFDIDGTLIPRGASEIPEGLFRKLVLLAERVPLALATARVCETSTERLSQFIAASPNPEVSRKHWFLVCENGARGLRWNAEHNRYEPWYTVPWPEDKLPKEAIFREIVRVVSDLTRNNTINVSSLSFRPKRSPSDTKESLENMTADIARRAKPIFESYSGHTACRIVDSGVGVHIMPKDGDKDRGIVEFARVLRETRGIPVSPDAREIVVIGDQPKPGMNDAFFLNGKQGTPFTVGDLDPENLLPYGVYDEQGNRLTGPEGTLYLLNLLFP